MIAESSIMDISLATLVGTVAGICSTGSFIPQVLKAWRDGDTDAISKKMYLITVSAFTLWIIYGLLIESLPITIFNILSLVLSGIILYLKLRARSRPGAAPTPSEPDGACR